MFKRIAIGCGGLIVLISILVGIALVGNWGDVRTRIINLGQIFGELVVSDVNNADGMLDYFAEEADVVSLVSYYVTPDGLIDETRPVLMQNESEPMVLASTIKIIVLAVYADAVASGEVEPTMPVSLAEWEQFYLPQSDGGAHVAALAELGIATTPEGFAVDSSETVTLEEMMWAMIRFSDNAAPDYLVDLLGDEAFDKLVSEQGLSGQTAYVPISGLFLSWQNHEQPDFSAKALQNLKALSPEAYLAEANALQERYATDAAWRAAEVEWRMGKGMNRLLDESALIEAVAPRGTAVDYARIMAGVVSETFISPEVSALMRPFLEWPMGNTPIQADFSAFGTKGGSLVKVMNEATYAVSLEDGQPQVVVLFLNDVPLAGWIQMVQNFGQQTFMIELLKNEAFRQTVWERLEN